MNYAIGVDLGGTKIKAGIVTLKGQILAMNEIPTPTRGDEIFAAILSLCQALRETWQPSALGVGSPGQISFPDGVVKGCTPNLSAWNGRHLKAELETHLSIFTLVDNDANVACYGEWKMGAGKDLSEMVLLTLGTGLGSGIVSGGRLKRGWDSFGIGFGHMIVENQGRWCNCGQQGCLETYVSGKGLSKTYRLLGGEQALSGEQIFVRAHQGESQAVQAVAQTLTYLGVGVTNILNTLAPEAIILGGGISRQGEKQLLLPLIEKVKGIMGMPFERPEVLRLATLRADAGMVGAGLMALEEYLSHD